MDGERIFKSKIDFALQLLTNRCGKFALLIYMSEFGLRVSSF